MAQSKDTAPIGRRRRTTVEEYISDRVGVGARPNSVPSASLLSIAFQRRENEQRGLQGW